MLNLSLAFLMLAVCLLIAGIVWLNVWIETRRVGGLYHWRFRSANRVYFGGSFYRSTRRLNHV